MIHPKISVIVPVHNTARYLSKCLDNLLLQTFPALEIIVIDDASTDHSRKILENYASQDARVRIAYHETSKGPGGCRATGLSMALGDYISFVDSDDWLDQGAYAYLYEKIEQEQVDILCFGFRTLDEQGNVLSAYSRQRFLQGTDTAGAYLRGDVVVALWNKLYRRSLFYAITNLFLADCYYDDLVASFHILCESKHFVEIPEIFYNYVRHVGSITAAVSVRHVADYKDAFYHLTLLHKQYHLPFQEELENCLARHAMYCHGAITTYGGKDLLSYLRLYDESLGVYAVLGMHQKILNQKTQINQFISIFGNYEDMNTYFLWTIKNMVRFQKFFMRIRSRTSKYLKLLVLGFALLGLCFLFTLLFSFCK
jgi:glycosyltransferase involved in cell wall biosynthesis